MSNLLQDKVVIVTGAASGIGRATAKLFAEQGAKVVAVDRAPEVEATVAEIRAAGGTALALQRDTSQENDVADYVETAVRHHGGLDVCFANAGVSGGLRHFDEWTVEDWTRILSINLIGTFLAIKYATRVMVPAGRGSIIAIAATDAPLAPHQLHAPSMSPYCVWSSMLAMPTLIESSISRSL